MLSLSEKDKANLLAILDCATKITGFVDGISDSEEFYEDEKTFDAVLMNFVVIGEAASKLSTSTKEAIKEIPWSKIKSFRDFIAHNYLGVNASEVWQIIVNDLAPLIKSIEKSIA